MDHFFANGGVFMNKKRLIGTMLSAFSALSSCCAKTYELKGQTRSYSTGLNSNFNRRATTHKNRDPKDNMKIKNLKRNMREKINKNNICTNYKDHRRLRSLIADSIRFKNHSSKNKTLDEFRDDKNAASKKINNTNNILPVTKKNVKLNDMNMKARLKEVGKAYGVVIPAMAVAYVPAHQYIFWPLAKWDMAREQKKKFNAEKSDMRTQRGNNWCWLAVFERLFALNGVKISQEKLYELLYNKKPWPFAMFRRQAGKLKFMFEKHFTDKMNSVNENLKLASVYFRLYDLDDQQKKSEAMRAAFLNFYKQTGNVPFYAVDSLAWSDIGIGHAVCIKEITESDSTYLIKVEDPTSGMCRTENLDTFVKRYWEGKGAKKEIDGVRFFALVNKPKADIPERVIWEPNYEEGKLKNINQYDTKTLCDIFGIKD